MYLDKHSVKNPGDALSYLTDCTLGTIEDLADRARPPKGELARQIELAQMSIDWMIRFNVAPTGRAVSVIKHGGNVAKWIEETT